MPILFFSLIMRILLGIFFFSSLSRVAISISGFSLACFIIKLSTCFLLSKSIIFIFDLFISNIFIEIFASSRNFNFFFDSETRLISSSTCWGTII